MEYTPINPDPKNPPQYIPGAQHLKRMGYDFYPIQARPQS